jgi:hypothetical protein
MNWDMPPRDKIREKGIKKKHRSHFSTGKRRYGTLQIASLAIIQDHTPFFLSLSLDIPGNQSSQKYLPPSRT